jgi:hypothetical protein
MDPPKRLGEKADGTQTEARKEAILR